MAAVAISRMYAIAASPSSIWMPGKVEFVSSPNIDKTPLREESEDAKVVVTELCDLNPHSSLQKIWKTKKKKNI